MNFIHTYGASDGDGLLQPDGIDNITKSVLKEVLCSCHDSTIERYHSLIHDFVGCLTSEPAINKLSNFLDLCFEDDYGAVANEKTTLRTV